MPLLKRSPLHTLLLGVSLPALLAIDAAPASAQGIVPGTGRKAANVGDDFEDPKWQYLPRLPKSSRNIDGRGRYPLGKSVNGRWSESSFRGAPDQVQRVETPEGGNPNSKGAMLLRTRDSGIPGRTSRESQQDDFMCNLSSRMGRVDASRGPNFMVRVYIPPFEQFDQRTDSSFGIRMAMKTTKTEKKTVGAFIFKRTKTVTEDEEYWPGFFLQFHCAADGKVERDMVMVLIRGNEYGNEVQAKQIFQSGWWTFGMSVTPDGRVHYYASPGTDRLTAADHLYSVFPYSYRTETVSTIFFNVISRNDGNHWSTPWIIDDVEFYTTR